MTWTWAEPFAGAAACTLRLVGGRDLAPPVAWMGGKRRLARAILDAMGVPEEPPSRVLLADAGPWGWVWPLLLEPESAAAVARVLRSWAGEHPRDLWQRLAAQPPAEDLHERAAQWLWLQARSASGVPIWWDGWRLRVEGRSVPQSTWDLYGDENAGRWKASDGRGEPRAAGQRAIGGRWEKGTPDARVPQDATNGQRGHAPGSWQMGKSEGRTSSQPAWQKDQPGSWRFDARPCDAKPDRPAGQAGQWKMGEEFKKSTRGDRAMSEKGTSHGRTGGMINPCTIAERAEAIAEAFARVAATVHHGDARGIEPGPGFCYLDPPYVGATGYGWDLPRGEVLELARRWHDAGAVVAVSEAEPLELEGWHHVELTREGGKPEWLTLSSAPARFPARQASLFAEPA